ncbi:helix-turn-helix domain-containing protein [Polaribacter marinivivus]|uniref:Helix-turn-helix domain-containing protein n=1 Tax=Polaribacter marinivivus TaxID=1524260 RepID=A0ABV8R7B6_9FLAO
MEKDYQKILQLLAKKRKEKGVTQYDISQKLGLTESGYFKIEKGTTRLDIMRFIVILNFLDVSPKDFFQELEETLALDIYKNNL